MIDMLIKSRRPSARVTVNDTVRMERIVMHIAGIPMASKADVAASVIVADGAADLRR
jgi:hypothetical protein